MLIILTVLILICGITLGIDEGMTMIQKRDTRSKWDMIEGVRGHEWFQHYHWINILERVVLIAVGYCLYMTELTRANIAILSGVLILCWQIFESFYSWTRYAEWIPESENVLGYWRTYKIIELAVARVVLATGLIVWGLI